MLSKAGLGPISRGAFVAQQQHSEDSAEDVPDLRGVVLPGEGTPRTCEAPVKDPKRQPLTIGWAYLLVGLGIASIVGTLGVLARMETVAHAAVDSHVKTGLHKGVGAAIRQKIDTHQKLNVRYSHPDLKDTFVTRAELQRVLMSIDKRLTSIETAVKIKRRHRHR